MSPRAPRGEFSMPRQEQQKFWDSCQESMEEFNGLVQEVNDRNRIKVNVNIFGRPTPIELSVNQILSES